MVFFLFVVHCFYYINMFLNVFWFEHAQCLLCMRNMLYMHIYAYLCVYGKLHLGHIELHLNETSQPGFRGENKLEISWPCT